MTGGGDILLLVEGALAFFIALCAWFGSQLLERLTQTLDSTAERLQEVGKTVAQLEARLDALEDRHDRPRARS